MMKSLDDNLKNLKAVIDTKNPKTQGIINQWIETWTRYLQFEDTFDPKKLIYYKRGDIVYAHFGFNVGNEYGGVHYAVVVENDNNNANGNIMVVPLTSLDKAKGESMETIHSSEVYLGQDLIPWKKGETVAKPEQIRSISKLRIIKPKRLEDQKATLNGDVLDLIDDKLKEMAMKKQNPIIISDDSLKSVDLILNSNPDTQQNDEKAII